MISVGVVLPEVEGVLALKEQRGAALKTSLGGKDVFSLLVTGFDKLPVKHRDCGSLQDIGAHLMLCVLAVFCSLPLPSCMSLSAGLACGCEGGVAGLAPLQVGTPVTYLPI